MCYLKVKSVFSNPKSQVWARQRQLQLIKLFTRRAVFLSVGLIKRGTLSFKLIWSHKPAGDYHQSQNSKSNCQNNILCQSNRSQPHEWGWLKQATMWTCVYGYKSMTTGERGRSMVGRIKQVKHRQSHQMNIFRAKLTKVPVLDCQNSRLTTYEAWKMMFSQNSAQSLHVYKAIHTCKQQRHTRTQQILQQRSSHLSLPSPSFLPHHTATFFSLSRVHTSLISAPFSLTTQQQWQLSRLSLEASSWLPGLRSPSLSRLRSPSLSRFRCLHSLDFNCIAL